MNIIEEISLSNQQKREITQLLSEIHQTDETFRDPYLSNQFNYFAKMPAFLLVYEQEWLIGFTMLYADGTVDEPAELYINVRPKYRKKGLATLMLHRARAILSSYGYQKITYVSEKKFLQKNPEFLQKNGLTVKESEYQMRALDISQKNSKELANSTLVIREMQKEDIDALILLQIEAFATSKEESKKYVTESYKDPSTLTFVLEYEEQVIGYSAVDNGQEYYFFGLSIASAYQNHGYGTFLVQTMMEILWQQQTKNFVLGVEKENLPAIHVYQNAGFHIETEIVYLV